MTDLTSLTSLGLMQHFLNEAKRKTPIKDFLPLWHTLRPLSKDNGCSLHICDYTVEYEGNSYILYETVTGEPVGIDLINKEENTK